MPTTKGFFATARRGFYNLARRTLMLWVKVRVVPENLADLALSQVGPKCYVLEDSAFSNRLILEHVCRELNLPRPFKPIVGLEELKRPAMIALERSSSINPLSQAPVRYAEGLQELLLALERDPELDVELVPVSIFVGRAPDRQQGWFSVLFTENWVVVGRLRRIFSILLNGRATIVQFAAPLKLRQAIDPKLDRPRQLRKVARILRTHFRLVRTAVIGPDLSHRRTLVGQILRTPDVRTAIAAHASKNAIGLEKANAQAMKIAFEIAADYSDPVVRSLSFLLRWFWNRLYDGVKVNHFEQFQRDAHGREIIYVPSHRSHIDYLLLSYLLYDRGVVCPHIVAGVNLNLPVVGTLLRGGGAFFMRRSFKSNPLYSAIFTEYVSALFADGVSMEYFIEGGRSRTGRLLTPRGGMLAMTLRAYLREPRRDVLFQPVYIGYERVAEGRSYSRELAGGEKQKENLFGLLKSLKMLRSNYGKVAVNFGEPILLSAHLDQIDPDWRAAHLSPDERPNWLPRAVDTLADEIMERINRAVDVNPINLLALVLLSTPKQAMDVDDLLGQLKLSLKLCEQLPYSERMTVTALNPEEIVRYGEKMEVIERVHHSLGDIIRLNPQTATLQTYYRNNVLHAFAVAGWVGCCFLNNREFERSEIVRLGQLVYPFLRTELYLYFEPAEFAAELERCIDFFKAEGLLLPSADGTQLRRAAGGSAQAFQIKVFGQALLQSFQRYYILTSLLVGKGSGVVSALELENLCHLTAQRLSLLFEFNAPEFFDKTLFRNFITGLRESGVVRTDDAGKLAFDQGIANFAETAKLILSKDIRHGILLAAPEDSAKALGAPALAP